MVSGIFDFDMDVQRIFDDSFSELSVVDWKKWAHLSSKEEHEELCYKNSGIVNIEDLQSLMTEISTNSRSFSINIDSFLELSENSGFHFFCHTSGTTNSRLTALKWFHMPPSLVQRLWAPGMKAIFESSGLNSKNSAIIFVPSRMNIDGKHETDQGNYVSLYSSEFSQRIMLSMIKPDSYLLYEYKRCTDLDVIAQMLSMKNIQAVSAPAATVLKWADRERLKQGIQSSLNKEIGDISNDAQVLMDKIKHKGIDVATREIHEQLSKKLSTATLVFSISSLSEAKWSLLRNFMKWKKGEEIFTNLYVGSEIGPFASSLSFEDDFKIARRNQMFVFPLTVPVLEQKGEKHLIHDAEQGVGRLMISRLQGNAPLINIDTGDIIRLEENTSIPIISGKIIRNGFQLQYPMEVSSKIKPNRDLSIFVGDYFYFGDLEIIEPRLLLNCLNQQLQLGLDKMLLLEGNGNATGWRLILNANGQDIEDRGDKVRNALVNCENGENNGLINAIVDGKVRSEFISEEPIGFNEPRSKLLEKVQRGEISKGILKKWPMYIGIKRN